MSCSTDPVCWKFSVDPKGSHCLRCEHLECCHRNLKCIELCVIAEIRNIDEVPNVVLIGRRLCPECHGPLPCEHEFREATADDLRPRGDVVWFRPEGPRSVRMSYHWKTVPSVSLAPSAEPDCGAVRHSHHDGHGNMTGPFPGSIEDCQAKMRKTPSEDRIAKLRAALSAILAVKIPERQQDLTRFWCQDVAAIANNALVADDPVQPVAVAVAAAARLMSGAKCDCENLGWAGRDRCPVHRLHG